jgi:SAM-dependent methyltransferase
MVPKRQHTQSVSQFDLAVLAESHNRKIYDEMFAQYYEIKKESQEFPASSSQANTTNEYEISQLRESLLRTTDSYGRFMEIGFGTGLGLFFLQPDLDKITSYCGMDLSIDMLKISLKEDLINKLFKDGILHLLASSMNTMPVQQPIFDTVFSINSLDYTAPEVVIPNIEKIMFSGGTLAFLIRHPQRNEYYLNNGIAEPWEKAEPFEDQGWVTETFPEITPKRVVKYYASQDTWKEHLQVHGFTNIEFTDTPPTEAFKHRFPDAYKTLLQERNGKSGLIVTARKK